jgi:hypothetical protein
VRDLKKDLKRLEESQRYFLKHGNECLVMDLGISIDAIKRAIEAEELLKELMYDYDREAEKPYCRICQQFKEHGHTDDCKLKQYLNS